MSQGYAGNASPSLLKPNIYITADVRLCKQPKDGKVPFVDRNMKNKVCTKYMSCI